jgi:XTP/dITP diphosphohydrolase
VDDQVSSRPTRPRLTVASSNRGKLAEFQALLGDDVDIISILDLDIESPEETGATFEDNALLKARHLHHEVGGVVLADDSGLEVDALSGEPGVRSARFAGDHHDDADNRALLLERMASVPADQRSARFVAAIAIIDTPGHESLVRQTCEGRITYEERGSNGFGYDPLFELPNGRTMAELTRDEKGAVSHRGKAVRAALPILRQALGADVAMEAPS